MAVQTVSTLADGMTITTADVVANIEVRAQSLGPGFCGTVVRSSTNRVDIFAPPGVWSGWVIIDPHLGKVTKTYSTEIICDTGAQFQIRYWK